ncbi:accessory factor UbiK family protein [Sneathiella litorea]|uniref:Accessory factor UbiK family protein n=1 Tax=Sneathiella litorea TaxID=2606216 RepID=A0A6L8WBL8_9PROT|nr:accessory factor UbiK family protein [Sneathiella litorea]MZR32455.1 accessory factor UbiK family protein [Sneathiella litorea]
MQTNSRLFDDLARLATGALGTAQGVKTEWENLFHQRMERFISEMDLVPREEFDAVKAMATLAREENDALKERLDALEKKLEDLAKPTRARKAAPRKAKSTSSEK